MESNKDRIENLEDAFGQLQDELWPQFGPIDFEDFDEALLMVQESNPFREYQKEFERLGNRVRGWTQKSLVGTFMGGLKPEIADGTRMFKPNNLKDATSLARMRDEQLNRLSPITQASSAGLTKNATMKRLTWDEMQKKRAQDLCFNCDEKFNVGHKCEGPRLLVMESALDEGDCESFVYQREP
ncbi:putative mitochondrial protein [Tanacetum coccineum]